MDMVGGVVVAGVLVSVAGTAVGVVGGVVQAATGGATGEAAGVTTTGAGGVGTTGVTTGGLTTIAGGLQHRHEVKHYDLASIVRAVVAQVFTHSASHLSVRTASSRTFWNSCTWLRVFAFILATEFLTLFWTCCLKSTSSSRC